MFCTADGLITLFGDFLVTLAKDASTYTFNQGNYIGGFYQIINSQVRYKCAWDTINVASGYHLYTKYLQNLVLAS